MGRQEGEKAVRQHGLAFVVCVHERNTVVSSLEMHGYAFETPRPQPCSLCSVTYTSCFCRSFPSSTDAAGKFGGLFASLPNAMVSGLFCVMFGCICAGAWGVREEELLGFASPLSLYRVLPS